MAIENFTTYTENDTSGTITVTSSKIDVSAIPEQDDDYVVKDKGANHFDGDFEHLTEAYINSSTVNGIHAIVWGMANVSNMVSTDGNAKLFVRAYDDTSAQFTCGYESAQDVGSVSANTLYYLKVVRDEAVGANGTLYCYIYSDSGRTTLVDTLVQALASKTDFRYIYGFANYGNEVGAYTWTGYSQNLDLQETGIAHDSSAHLGETTATSQTTAFTNVSGDILFVGVVGAVAVSNNITGVTYNGVSLTLVNEIRVPSDRWVSLWYLINPATGSNNVVVSSSPSEYIQSDAITYSGAKQTGQPDASTTDSATSVTTRTTSVTTVADNCWTVMMSDPNNGGGTAGTGTVKRTERSTTGQGLYDSNGPITPAGSTSLIVNFTSGNYACVMASIAPAVAVGGAVTVAPTLTLLNVG